MKGDVQGGLTVYGHAHKGALSQQPTRVPQVQAAVGFAAWRAGDQEAARRAFAQAKTLADQRDTDTHTKAVAWTFIGKVYLWCGLRLDARRAARNARSYRPSIPAMPH